MDLVVLVGLPASGKSTFCRERLADTHVVSRVTECLLRNRQREGRARVPGIATFTAARRLERPSRTEGFEVIFQVALLGPPGFEMAGFREDAESAG